MSRSRCYDNKCFNKFAKLFFIGVIIFVCNQTIWNSTWGENTQSRQQFPEQNNASELMINTYMRSGSSFLGRVLGFRNDTFYMYEPLWSMARDFYYAEDGQKCGTYVPKCRPSQELNVALAALHQLYDCTFFNRPMSNIFSSNINAKLSGQKWSIFKLCKTHRQTEENCLKQMSEKVCQVSKYKVTKVLRLSLANVDKFLASRPQLKVVHLFRDPRAVISSHIRTPWSPIRERVLPSIEAGAQAICNRIAVDVKYGEILKQEFPDRFFIVQYEDFESPLPELLKLYKLLDIPFTEEVKQYIAPTNNDQSGSSKTQHSGNHPFLYRYVMNWKMVQIIDKYCAEVYKALGYKRFYSEAEFRNMSISAIDSKLHYRLPVP